MSVKYKILTPIILVSLALLAKFILWDFDISTGKRSGNLVKLSKKGKVLKTWEGTLDLGSGDKLTFDFSVKDDVIAQAMYDYTGREVTIFYEEHIIGWPRDTKHSVVKWSPKDFDGSEKRSVPAKNGAGGEDAALEVLNKTLFCSVIGSLYQDQDLYGKVKGHLKENNLYLYRQIEKCNN